MSQHQLTVGNLASQTTPSNQSNIPPIATTPNTSESQLNLESQRSRTRGAQTRLSASLRSMSRAKLVQALLNTTVNSQIIFTIASSPDWIEQAHTGTVIALNDSSRIVQTPTFVIRLPLDSDDHRVITSLSTVKRSIMNIALNITNNSHIFDANAPTIFLDGGARPNPGPAGAAILARIPLSLLDTISTQRDLVQRLPTTDPDADTYAVERHSAFMPLATNNQAEFAALVAALRLGTRWINKNVKMINIVMDSELAYKTVLGINKTVNPELADLGMIAKELFYANAQHFCMCTIMRSHGNPADMVATATIRSAASCGDANLFTLPSVRPTMPRIQQTPAPTQALNITSANFPVPKTTEQFVMLKRFPTRTRVASTYAHLWSQMVKYYLQAFFNSTPELKQDAAMRIFMLPHAFLPARSSTNKIQKHLSLAKPFSLRIQDDEDDDDANTIRAPRQHDVQHHRLCESITRLVSDRKLRTANRLLQASAESDEIPFHDKVEVFKAKILQRTSEVPQLNFPMTTIPAFSANELKVAITKLNRQAALAIDGWSKDLFTQAIEHDNEILPLLADFLHWLVSAPIPALIGDVLRTGRGVAIPKPEGGSRPIILSSAFAKLIGNIAMGRDDTSVSHLQHAIGEPNGHVRIVHKLRNHLNNHDNSLIRLDVSNAFGKMPRDVMHKAVSSRDPTLQQYFRLVYGAPSPIAVYGPSAQHYIHTMSEGVKQGDSTSSFLFCAALDRALVVVEKALRAVGIHAHIYAYMDDISIVVENRHVDRTSNTMIDALKRLGLSVNTDKSKILTHQTGQYCLPSQGHSASPFVVLGANLAQHDACCDVFEQEYIDKQKKYFDKLHEVSLHPQIEFTILRICGNPRIQYMCSVTNPAHTAKLTNYFQRTVMQRLMWMLDNSGNTTLTPEQLHTTRGLGIADYSTFRFQLYEAHKKMSLQDEHATPVVSLLHDTNHSTNRALAQINSEWMFFEARNYLTPAEFVTALAIRIDEIPHNIRLIGTKCNCGFIYTDSPNTIHHILKCDMSCSVTHTTRHNMVRDAIARTVRAYGIAATTEPTFFVYNDGHKRRPDILIHTAPFTLTTDVSLVDEEVDLTRAEEEKKKQHTNACAKLGSHFVPGVMHTRGTLGKSMEDFIRQAAKATIPSQSQAMQRDLHHSISIAAAKGRALALMSAAQRVQWSLQ